VPLDPLARLLRFLVLPIFGRVGLLRGGEPCVCREGFRGFSGYRAHSGNCISPRGARGTNRQSLRTAIGLSE
jgi:hypothetical protein